MCHILLRTLLKRIREQFHQSGLTPFSWTTGIRLCVQCPTNASWIPIAKGKYAVVCPVTANSASTTRLFRQQDQTGKPITEYGERMDHARIISVGIATAIQTCCCGSATPARRYTRTAPNANSCEPSTCPRSEIRHGWECFTSADLTYFRSLKRPRSSRLTVTALYIPESQCTRI